VRLPVHRGRGYHRIHELSRRPVGSDAATEFGTAGPIGVRAEAGMRCGIVAMTYEARAVLLYEVTMDERAGADVEGGGAPALGSDGDLVGRVKAVGEDHIILARPVGPDVSVPLDAIRDDLGDALILKESADPADPMVPPDPLGEG
jgi:hypothetical protein